MHHKVEIFVASSFLAGLAGSIYASSQRAICPEDFTLLLSIYILIYAVVGGLGSFMGPVYGVVFLVGLPVLLRQMPNYDPKAEPLILGIVLIITLITCPGGLSSLCQRILPLIRHLRKDKISARERLTHSAGIDQAVWRPDRD